MRALKACRSYSRRTRGSWESGFQCCRRLLSRAPQGSVLSDNSGRPLQHRQFGDHHWIVAVLCCKHRNGTHAPSGEVDQWVYSRPKEKTVPSSGVLTCMWRKLLTSRVHVKVCPLAHIHHRAAVWASSVGHEAACRHSVAHPLSDVGSHSRRGDKVAVINVLGRGTSPRSAHPLRRSRTPCTPPAPQNVSSRRTCRRSDGPLRRRARD